MKVKAITTFLAEQLEYDLGAEDSFDIILKIVDLEKAIDKINPELEIDILDFERLLDEAEDDEEDDY